MREKRHTKENCIVSSNATSKEITARESFMKLFSTGGDITETERLNNLGLFISRQSLSRILYMHELYSKIINVHGVVMEFGVRWGQNMALFGNFRGIYEPFNYNRKIIGFDTFEGFTSLDKKDGDGVIMQEGAYSVSNGYENVLQMILDYHESESPISHIKKYELIKGDATVTVKKYFEDNPHTIVALAYFDFDIYKPTFECLRIINEHVTKGSVIAFDELNCKEFPGETIALKEVLGLGKYAIKRVPYNSLTSYVVVE
ncbi:MAG: hypothetical protein FWF87_00155 [Synergistaceae bacterium]|nr:hypothetical protein [Synergistaceae bacterium]